MSTAPVTGKVLEVNEDLAQDPEKSKLRSLRAKPDDKVELPITAELDSLMDGAAYEKYCENGAINVHDPQTNF